MSIFNRLFGSKKNNVEPENYQQKQSGKPEQENPEKKLNPNSEQSQTNSPVNPDPEIKKKPKEAKSKVTDSKAEIPQSGIPWRTFPIFISSTFADMQAERDHLKNVVFPMVEEELQQRRIKLEIVDLRWGVDTSSMAQEDEREASVLKVCLDEIRRCRPFFIGLLGDRYGWVPPLERMQTALVGEEHITPKKGKSVTDLEIEFGVLASKEQLVRSVFYFREPLPYETFSQKKAAMFSDEYNMELSEAEKAERKTALEKLKTNIRNHFSKQKLENKVKTYSGTWDAEKEKLADLETWGNTVYTDILAECESHARDTWDKVPQNWQEQELALLDAFIEQHTHITTTIKDGKPEPVPTFCGREELLKELRKHLLSDDSNNWGVVLTGESGSGKSAVFSMVNKMMQQENCFILAHSAGISPRAKKVADLLKIWNNLLRKHLGMDQVMEDTSPSHPSPFGEGPGVRSETPIEELQKLFTELLQMASAKKRVVLLIDALDRFEPTARAQHLSWLPSVMTQNVRLLCTAITGTEKKAVQYHKGLTTKSIDSFTSAEAKEMLDALCLRQHKTLPAKIEKIILEKKRADGQPATSSPLWLSLAVNMLMAIDLDDFEKMSQLEGRGDQQIESYLAAMAISFDPLPGPLFLSLKNKAGLLFGETFTNAVFNYLAISRNGLREKDFEKLLHAKGITWDPLKFSGLRRWFKSHLVLQGEELQWTLAHSILRSALIQNTEESQRVKLHGTVAKYLLPLRNDPLKATETMYHLINASNSKEAALYYSNDLTDEEAAGATTVLTETATTDVKGLDLVSKLPGLVLNEYKSFRQILRRYIYELNILLEVDGNLAERLTILEKLKENLTKNFIKNFTDEGFGSDAAATYEKLGDIHQTMGHMEEAFKYFDDEIILFKELYEANPHIQYLKYGLATSYGKLGNIYESMGNMKETFKYIEDSNQLFKELYETSPHHEWLKKGFASSNGKLGDIHQSMGHMEEALKYFDDVVGLFNELYEANPSSESVKNGLANSYGKKGELYIKMGNLDEGLTNIEKASKLFKEFYIANPRSESLKKGLAYSYQNLGIIHQSMGHMEEALIFFELCVQLSKELYEANPLGESLKKLLAISYDRLGSFHQSAGSMEESLKYFKDFNQLIKELHETNPSDESLKNGLASSYQNLGIIYQLMGHIEEAFKYFQKFNQLEKELYEANPRNELLKNGLAISYSKLGEIHQSMGHMEEALKYFDDVVGLFKELYEANPHNESLKNGLAISYSKLADIYQSIGHMEEALQYFENFNQLQKELNEANPRSEEMKNGLAISYGKLGEIHQSMGQMEEALKYFDDVVGLFKELYEANPRNESLKDGLASSYQNLGIIHQLMGHIEEAFKYFQNFNQLEKELYEANPHNELLKNGLAISYSKLGDIHLSMGHMEQALKYFENNLKLTKELYEANPRSESLKDGLASSYQFLGNIHQAMGHIEEALQYFEIDLALTKELYEANPQHIHLLENLGISYYKLAVIYKALSNNVKGKEHFGQFKKIVSFLATNVPQVSKYQEMDKVEYLTLIQNESYSFPNQTDTIKDNDLNKEHILIKNLIQNTEYEKAFEILKAQEETLRNKKYNPVEFQENVGEQAFVLSKLGKYKEALQKYEIQSESFARTQMVEDYADCLVSQAELLIYYLNNPKHAKSLLEEAISVAAENNLNHIMREAENMLKKVK